MIMNIEEFTVEVALSQVAISALDINIRVLSEEEYQALENKDIKTIYYTYEEKVVQ